jgi:hypothetical protein
MGTKIALGGSTGMGIYIYGIVGTGGNAGFASYAGIAVELDDAIIPLEHGCYRTDIDTGRLGTMIAAQHPEVSLGVGESSFLDILDKGPIHRKRNLILGFAGRGAGMTADTLPLINCPGIIHTSPRIEFLKLFML